MYPLNAAEYPNIPRVFSVEFLYNGVIFSIWVSNMMYCTFHLYMQSNHQDPITLYDLVATDMEGSSFSLKFNMMTVPDHKQFRPSFKTMVKFYHYLQTTDHTASNVLDNQVVLPETNRFITQEY